MDQQPKNEYVPFWYRSGFLGILFVMGGLSLIRAIPEIPRLAKIEDFGGIAGTLTIPISLLGWCLFASLRNASFEKQAPRQSEVLVEEKLPFSPPAILQRDETYDDLIKLAELKDKGILTQEEFDAKKRLILGL